DGKIQNNGIPLNKFLGGEPIYGIKTGLNTAFLISNEVKEQMAKESPFAKDVIHPYLRGQDIKRWHPEWEGLWIILLRSSADHPWPWADFEGDSEDIFQKHTPLFTST
ncbi:MAG: hypothetical protein HC812_16975, partial [Leptolyngbya sp. RL_3_1]|nr:hypothetical protein [Leptolyngbya sp. RL_3_1]